MNPLDVTEAEIGKLRVRLEAVFHNLNTIHDFILVCSDAAKQVGDHGPEFSHCLLQFGANDLYSQLTELTNVIECLGGTTEFTKEQAELRASMAQARAENKA
jgi:hypothetical protein